MGEILHKITIAAPPATVYAALTEQRGLASWWTKNVQAEFYTPCSPAKRATESTS